MEPDICPPWWPWWLWWFIHHPHGPGPDPGPIDREAFTKIDRYLSTFAIAVLSSRLGDARITQQAQSLVGPAASDAMSAIASLGAPRK